MKRKWDFDVVDVSADVSAGVKNHETKLDYKVGDKVEFWDDLSNNVVKGTILALHKDNKITNELKWYQGIVIDENDKMYTVAMYDVVRWMNIQKKLDEI